MSNKKTLIAGRMIAEQKGKFRIALSAKGVSKHQFTLQALSKDKYRLIIPGTKEGKECIAIIGSKEEGWLSTELKALSQYQQTAINNPKAVQITPIMDVIREGDIVIIFQEMRRGPRKRIFSHYPLTSQQEKRYIGSILCNSANIFPQDAIAIPYSGQDFFISLLLRCLDQNREHEAQKRGFISEKEITRLRELLMSAPAVSMRKFFSDFNETLLTRSKGNLYLWNITTREYPIFFETALWLSAVTVHAHQYCNEWLEKELSEWLYAFVAVYERHYDTTTIMHMILLNLAAEYMRLLTIDLPLRIGLVQQYDDDQLHNAVTIVQRSLNHILQYL